MNSITKTPEQFENVVHEFLANNKKLVAHAMRTYPSFLDYTTARGFSPSVLDYLKLCRLLGLTYSIHTESEFLIALKSNGINLQKVSFSLLIDIQKLYRNIKRPPVSVVKFFEIYNVMKNAYIPKKQLDTKET